MTDEVKNPETHVDEHIDPLEKAKAGGYVEPEPPSRDERVKALIADFEHVAKHNSPIPHHLIGELKALLAPEVVEAESEAASG